MAGLEDEWAKRGAVVKVVQISATGAFQMNMGPDPMRFGLILSADQANLIVYALSGTPGPVGQFWMPAGAQSVQLLRSDWGDFITLPVWVASPIAPTFPTIVSISYAADRYDTILRYYHEQFSI